MNDAMKHLELMIDKWESTDGVHIECVHPTYKLFISSIKKYSFNSSLKDNSILEVRYYEDNTISYIEYIESSIKYEKTFFKNGNRNSQKIYYNDYSVKIDYYINGEVYIISFMDAWDNLHSKDGFAKIVYEQNGKTKSESFYIHGKLCNPYNEYEPVKIVYNNNVKEKYFVIDDKLTPLGDKNLTFKFINDYVKNINNYSNAKLAYIYLKHYYRGNFLLKKILRRRIEKHLIILKLNC